MSILEEYKNEFLNYFNDSMNSYFNDELVLDKACLYSLFAGGKRIRPLITLLVAQIGDGDLKLAKHFGCAVEMIHTYSLIHDDLPAMDDDDYRRGKLTSHKKYTEGIAVLAGDALLNEAPLFMASYPNLDIKKSNLAVFELLNASGRQGMIKGQILDIINEGVGHKNLLQDEKLILIQNIHNHKTGKLFALSCLLGVLCMNNINEKKQRQLMEDYRKFGLELGLLFQIRDDIIDKTKSFKELGKTPGKDEKTDKLTYVSILTLEGARAMALKTHDHCLTTLSRISSNKNSKGHIGMIELFDFLKKSTY